MRPGAGDANAEILVVDGRIAAIGHGFDRGGRCVIDARGCVVMPGFVDTHRHAWQGLIRHVGAGWDVWQYLASGHGLISPRLAPDHVYLGTALSALTALDSGITTVCDEAHSQHSREHTLRGIEAWRESGLRARYGYGWASGPHSADAGLAPHPGDLEWVRAHVLPDDGALVSMYAMLRGPGMARPEVNLSDMRRARELGLRMSMHVAHTAFPEIHDLAEVLQTGDLDDLIVIHAGAATDPELRELASRGASISIAPVLESLMPGIGVPVTARAIAAGLTVGFSTDTEAAGSGDMFGVLRSAYLADGIRRVTGLAGDTSPPVTPRELLEIATRGGAEAAGIAHLVGSLAPGMRADMIVVDLSAVNLISAADPASTLLLNGHAGNIRTVIVDGEILKDDFLLRDRARLDAIATAVRREAPRLTAASAP